MDSSRALSDFLPFDIGIAEKSTRKAARRKRDKSAKALKEISVSEVQGRTKSNVIYVGRIPHGFYEEQMRGFFSQFGNIRRLRISRNKKTGKSRHFAFIEFESPEVAEIVADSMHNYLLFEHVLQVRLVPTNKIHPRMWVGSNRVYKPPNWQQLERIHHNRERGPEEQERLLEVLLKKDDKRRKKLKAAGIEYEYPDLRDMLPAVSKKIKFDENEE